MNQVFTIRILFILLTVMAAAGGCDFRKRENALQQREMRLQEKEQALVLKEKAIAAQLDSLQQLQSQPDSLAKQDSTLVVDSTLNGNWTVNMTCTETTCSGSAIGDTKTEQWSISYRGRNLVAKALVNGTLTRVYTGHYNGTAIELSEDNSTSPGAPGTKMLVRLRRLDAARMEGQREIERENNCRVVYALQLQKNNG